MKFRIIYLLVLVTALASLTQSSSLLDSDPDALLQADDAFSDAFPDDASPDDASPDDASPDDASGEMQLDEACDEDSSLCPKTRGASGFVGGLLGLGTIAKAVIKSGVGIFKNIVGIPDPPEVINVVVPPQQQQVIVGPPGVIVG
ncbi:uncharacterized protein LOC114330670 isoform X1 [Diabrotica virgifera virgifera]|uniref:Uncharacterized protein LOC114330670 isoform X1 n=1 Tax=Diabrotica virgifera virgifera TaxID=50390 RepID=A0A6P7FIX1_DIAVI|nr:uncharacterized protein LOC114330670 isoform X1 [Diabrotica virgifera virgifera]